MKKIMFNDKFLLTQAVLDGRKTQTRRIITPQPTYKDNCGICWKGYAYGLNPIDFNDPFGSYINFVTGTEYDKSCRRYRRGEVVAVAQSYETISNAISKTESKEKAAFYCKVMKVCFPDATIHKDKEEIAGWYNKMFTRAELMPHQIRITDVRVERLQDISDEDCLKEGIIQGKCGSKDTHFMDAYYVPNDIQPYCTPREAFAFLIEKVSGKGTWDANPYVWVYDFELIK